MPLRHPILALAAMVCSLTPILAEDWPRWRGPRADGTWNAPKLPAMWPEGGLRTVWKQPIGSGYAGISVADGRLYTLDLESPIPPRKKGESAGDGPDGTERVLCLDAATGNILWSHRYPVKYGNLGGYANGPRSQPTIHDGKVYTLGADGHLFCFDAKSGEILWKHDAVAEFGAKVPEWGFAGSPVIDGDRLFVHVAAEKNGCMMAFDRQTGKELWRSLPDPAGYCTPVVIEAKSGKQLVFWTPENIHGLDPATGRSLWKVPYKVTYGVSIAPPIFRDDIVFVTGYWEGSKAIRLGQRPTDAELLWTDAKQLRGIMAQPLYRDGHVYTIDRSHGLTCFELKTGKVLWNDDNQLTPKARNPHASIVWLNGGGRALALNAVGELVLCRLSPRGYEEESRTKVLDGRVWGHPAFAGRYLYAKTDGGEAWRNAGPHEIRCVELVGE
jgi:outer membrane protein assembly factor BamB